jgi:hypothetical protein
MTIYYVDPENGNNTNNGTSFALRKKDLTNVTATAGDEVRIIASKAPVSTGLNGTWTSQSGAVSGVNISSSTNANPIAVTTSAAHGLSTGDTVLIQNHGTNTNANGTHTVTVTGSTTFTIPVGGNGVGGATGTVQRRTGQVITLSSSVVDNLGFATAAQASTGWAGVTNSVYSIQTNSKEGHYANQLAVNATFTTGKIGYCTLPGGARNLSGYQQVCFWIMQTTGTLAGGGAVSIRLCSDTLGDTVVNAFNLDGIGALNTWYPVVLTNNSNLGSSIASVSLALGTDSGAQTFRFTNPFVAKASSASDCLTLNTMIGKGGTNTYYHIMSIVGTRVVLDNGTTMPNVARLPVTATETVAIWKQDPLICNTQQSTTSMSGSSGNPVTISGGWNRTDMSTQTGESAYDFQFRTAAGFASATGYLDISNISASRVVGTAVSISGGIGSVVDVNQITACANTSGVTVGLGANPALITAAKIDFNSTTRGLSVENTAGNYTGSYGVDYIGASNHAEAIFCSTPGAVFETVGTIENCGGYGVRIQGGNQRFKSITQIKNMGNVPFYCSGPANGLRIDSAGTWSGNTGYALLAYGDAYINNLTTTGHTGVVSTQSYTEKIYARNCTFNEATKVQFVANYANIALYSQNNSGSGLDVIYTDGGTIESDTTTRHTASGKSWALKPTSTSLRTVTCPLDLTIARIAVSANSLVTVKAWMQRTNTALNMKLVCPGGQIAGVSTDVEASVTASANTWEELTITFTPTEAGVVAIEAIAWGGSTHTGYVDDLTITQA